MKPKYDLSGISAYVADKIPEPLEYAIILGSGLSGFTAILKHTVNIPYHEIKGYPLPSVTGHIGEFIFGYAGKVPVLCARGRFHYYDGHSMERSTLPLRVYKEIGCSRVIITNAAGCMNKNWKIGELMILEGHLDCTYRESSCDPDWRQNASCYHEAFIRKAEMTAARQGLIIRKGKYCWTLGPTYETPAEIQNMSQMGGDAVGMSTVPEIEEAEKLGLKCLGISCLTNYAAGISPGPLSHSEVLETTERVKSQFAELISGIIVN